MPPYQYRAFGLNIRSEIRLPELIDHTAEPDVVIRLGEVRDRLPEGRVVDAFHQVTEDTMLLTVERVGRYLVERGQLITIMPFAGSLDSDLRLFLLGSCIGALLQQRDVLALHASAVVGPQGAVLFAGLSGVGKSTLLASFLSRGYLMLADDITAVHFTDDDRVEILPGISRLKLWADAAASLGYEQSHLDPLRPGALKFGLAAHNAFSPEPEPLDRIFILMPGDTAAIAVDPIHRLDRFQALLDNTYRDDLMAGYRREKHFQQIATLAAQAGLYRVARPIGTAFNPQMLADRLEREMLAAST